MVAGVVGGTIGIGVAGAPGMAGGVRVPGTGWALGEAGIGAGRRLPGRLHEGEA